MATIALAAMVACAPSALSQTHSYGSFVGKSDPDFTPTAKAQTSTLCFIDDSANGVHNLHEPIYLHLAGACTAVGGKDIRIVDGDPGPAGSEVKGSDADFNVPLTSVAIDLVRFADSDGDGKIGSKDAAYIDMDGSFSVSVGDLRLTKAADAAPGTIVVDGDGDLVQPLSDLAGGLSVAAAGTIYKAGDGMYVNVDGGAIGTSDVLVEENDIRLNSKVKSTATSNAPELDVLDLSIPIMPVAGEGFQVHVTVANTDRVAGSGLVTILLDDTMVDARGTPTLLPGESTTIVATLFAPPGIETLTVHVGDANLTRSVDVPHDATAAQLAALHQQVAAMDDQVSTAQDESTQARSPAPGGLPLLILMIASALMLARARRH